MNSSLPFRRPPLAAASLTILAALAATVPALGANPPAGPEAPVDQSALAAFVESRESVRKTDQQATAERAAALGLPLRLERDGQLEAALVGFAADGRPLYLAGSNADAARSISTDQVWTGGSAGIDLGGNLQRLAIWDVGMVRDTHQEMAGRVTRVNVSPISNDHATHVAGTMIATGIDGSARGMAKAATLRSWDFFDDATEMAAAQMVRNRPAISNHSYGLLSGWEFGSFGCPNGADPQWYFIGNVAVSTQEDAYFGLYEENAAAWDEIAHASPDYLIFKAAGNDRDDQPPFQPIVHCQWNGSLDGGEGGLEESSIVIPRDGGATGFDTLIGGSSSAKNPITVGAVEDLPNGYAGPASVVMTAFSSWGPTDDGRIKPDLVANGTALFSAVATADAAYDTFTGTSMAAPNASGSAALLRQHAANLGQSWRAATYKALILHTADEAGAHPGPDYSFGWGLMNTRSAVQLMTEHQLSGGRIHQAVLAGGSTHVYTVSSNGGSPLKVTLAWTDPAGAPVPPTVLDSPDPVLVNDLDLWASRPENDVPVLPWVLDPAHPANAATTGDNDRDNVEQISIEAPVAGVYTFTIGHEGSLEGGSQAYGLIVSGGSAVRTVEDGF